MPDPALREPLFYTIKDTAFGVVLAACSERGISYLSFHDSNEPPLQTLQREFPDRAPFAVHKAVGAAALNRLKAAIGIIQSGSHETSNVPLDPSGTPFQATVWRYLQAIPTGETRSYKAVASAIGHPSAHRAVATACAANRIAVLIPCHRVVRSDGSLCGYRWGDARKRALLEREHKKTSRGDQHPWRLP
jgi:AraC family transcriptional regulator of adaptative response/methylated-DNA-[protein]-cysteine methyltransferase